MPNNKKQTSRKAATEASKLLRTSKDKNVKTVAGSDLSQAPLKPRPKKK